MGIEQILQNEIQESQRALDGPNDDTIYRRDQSKRIDLINWVLENMKNPDIQICAVIESKMNEIIDAINEKHNLLLPSVLFLGFWIGISLLGQVFDLTPTYGQAQTFENLWLVKTNGHFTVVEGTPILSVGHTKTDYDANEIPGLQKGSCPSEIIVYVHGYGNNEEEDYLPIFTTARKALDFNKYHLPLVGFSWDSKFLNWWTAKKMASEVGPKLAQFILDFKNKCPSDKIRLIAHSLGARVTLTALNILNNNIEWNERKFKVESIHLLGGAVDNEQVSMNVDDCSLNSIPPLPCSETIIEKQVNRFTNLYNSEDDVLEFVYPAAEFDWALGKDGAEEGVPLPTNYRQQDVVTELPDEDDHITYGGKVENGVLVSDGAWMS